MSATPHPGASGEPEAPPSELRLSLFAAVDSGDRDELFRLCQTHRAEVLDAFPTWRRVPADARADPRELKRYASGLLGVAACFAERLGEPQLLEALTGADAPGSNPLVEWEQALAEASVRAHRLDYAAAIELLVDTLIDTRDLRGSGVDHYLPRTYGLLGDCYFQAGRAEEAIQPTLRALELSERGGDADARQAFVARLYEVHRYLGQAEPAAKQAEALAESLPEGRTAEWFRTQARWLRAGEPLCRVALEVEGERVELPAVSPELAGPYRFVYVRNRPPLHPARVWNERGEAAGRRGEVEEAFQAFAAAAAADPYDPHPHYQRGTLALYAERYFEAVESLARAEELAPGWFEVRTRLRLARELALGTIGRHLLELARELERGDLDPREGLEKLASADEGGHPLLLLHQGRCQARLGEGARAREDYEVALERAEDDPALRTRLHLELALVCAEEERRVQLERAIELDGHLVAAGTARLLLARQ